MHLNLLPTWLDQDARASAVLERFSADIIGFDHAYEMWAFLRECYESTSQSTYIAALCQEQLLRQGDSTVDDFYAQMYAVWRQLDSIGLSPSTCDSCKAQKVALETRRTHDFLTRLRDEFEQLRAQLVSRVPCVSLMEALVAVRNEELRLRNADCSLRLPLFWLLLCRLQLLHLWCLLQHRLLLRAEGVVVFIVTIVVRRLTWKHIATRRRRLSLPRW